MTDRIDHRAEAERLLNDADEWGQQAGEPTPEVGELACLAYSVAHALLAIHDTLTAADPAPTNPLTETHPWPVTGLTHTRGTQWGAGDRYALNEMRQREEAELDTPSGRAFTAQGKEATDAVRAKINALGAWLPAMGKALTPEPDPLGPSIAECSRCGGLYVGTAEATMEHHRACTGETPENPMGDPLDEDDHRDRIIAAIDAANKAQFRQLLGMGGGRRGAAAYYFDRRQGPLAFAPEPPQEVTGDDLSASGDEGGSVEGPDADIAHKAAMEAAFRKMLAIVEGWEESK